jgi:hypothetical protein
LWFVANHRQVQASRATVDEGMAELLEAVWAAGIDTQFSCQGGPDEEDWPHPGYIVFPTIGDAVRFLQATADRMEHHEYERLMMSPAKPPGGYTGRTRHLTQKGGA